MHFQPDLNPDLNVITACDASAIKINHMPYESSIWVTPSNDVHVISIRDVKDIDDKLIAAIAQASPEVVLIGTGARQHFVHPALLAPLTSARIGVECMSSDAACRTYNVLMSEGRHVLALILLPA